MAGKFPDSSNKRSQKSDSTEATQVKGKTIKKASLPGIIKYGSLKEAFTGIANETYRHHNQAIKAIQEAHTKAVNSVVRR